MPIQTPYEDLLADILASGIEKTDRTGTGTLSVFGRQMRFNLQESFPVITTKKVAWKSVVGELLWFLQGDTNNRSLQKHNISIWDEWADEDGSLGAIYGSSWRAWSHRSTNDFIQTSIRTDKYSDYVDPTPPEQRHSHPHSGYSLQSTYPNNKREYALWQEMLRGVENPDAAVTVSPIWRSFDNFLDTITTVPGYAQWSRGESLILNPHHYGAATYSPNTVVFAAGADVLDNPSKVYQWQGKLWGRKQDIFDAIHAELTINGTSPQNISVVHAKLQEHPITIQQAEDGFCWQKQLYRDQIAEVIHTLRTNPDSRRIIVNSWNVGELDNMALPPCHMSFQFYVADGKLSCHLYQRSADMFLGVPFNIASYSLLTHMIAKEVGLEVGEFVWTGGDCHIYANHIEQVREQLSREPRPYPQLQLSEGVGIFNYKIEDCVLVDYDPHPPIAAPVAV